jgi:hypothetical protein
MRWAAALQSSNEHLSFLGIFGVEAKGSSRNRFVGSAEIDFSQCQRSPSRMPDNRGSELGSVF